ncbi:MAG: molecular chaperone [Proteobacteria bacterium]|nr:MAG: molecular chaperone [Pseudomonadota bacterium]
MLQHLLPRGFLAAGLLAISGVIAAAGLQVAPIGLNFAPSSPAQGLWLTNTGGEVLHAQVRVFDWTQVDGKDNLAPTQALVVSPPMLSLEPGARQLVRVIRTDATATQATEDAYRLLVDELPSSEQAQQTGVRYVLRYSVPVFIEPSVRTADVSAVSSALSWSLEHDNDGIALQVHNAGISHAQISDVSLLLSDNEHVEITPGLLGYVLAGMTMRWTLNVPVTQFEKGTQLKARINGKTFDQTFPVGDLPY